MNFYNFLQIMEKFLNLNLVSNIFTGYHIFCNGGKAMELKVWTDGACSGNPGPGGWGVIITDKYDNIISQTSGFESSSTNNRMELQAAIEGIKESFLQKNAKKITIFTDSIYLKNGITDWIIKWKKNDWKTSDKKSVKNQDLWIILDDLISKYPISWEWVRGHSNNGLNNLADGLAVSAIKKNK